MFELSYHAGANFETSYFVGREGNDLKVVRASFVVPADVQAEVVKAETEGKENPAIIAPEEALEQIKTASGNTMEGFKKWADEIRGTVKAASLTKKADAPTYSFAEKEIAKVQLPKDGEVIISQNVKEGEEGKELDLSKSKATKVKQFYNRLPKAGPGEAEKTINLSSSVDPVHEKYQIAIQALAELTEKNESLNKEKDELAKGKDGAEKELGKVKDELNVDKKKGEIDTIVAAIKKGAKLDADAEKTVIDALSPLEQSVLKAISKVIDAIFAKKEEKAPAMNPFEKKPAPGMPGVNPFEPKKASSMPGVDLPQIGSSAGMETSVSLINTVEKLFDHN